MIQLANFEEREFYVMLGKIVTSVDVTFTFQMTEEEFTATLTPVSSTLRASKFAFTATTYPEGQYIVKFVETGQTEVLATVAGFVSGNPIFATSQYNTYNDDGTSTTYVPSDDQGLVPSVSQKLRVSTLDLGTDVSYVRYLKVTNGTLTDNRDNSVTLNTGGASSLDDLDDVTITAPLATGQVIVYDHDASPRGFHNQENSLANLTDTQVSGAAAGTILSWNGAYWVPVAQSTPPATTDALSEGTTNLYYTEARVSANTDVAANTAKVGITAQQAADITTNNAKTSFPGFGTTEGTALEGDTTTITTDQANAITANTAKVSLIAGGTTGQALVKSTGTDYDVEWADIAVDVQYHNRFETDAETFRSGATDTVELYYTAKADGDGLAESASSDTPSAGNVIRRKLWYAEKAFADPDTSGDWTQFADIADDTTFVNAKAALLAYLKERTGGTVPISLKQTWEDVPPASNFLDLYPDSAGAWSLRLLSSTYTGNAIQVRRDSDSTTQDIGFDANGDLDESALTAFVGSGSGYVSIFYDQSGNGRNFTQTSTSIQPRIVNAGTVDKINNKPAIYFDFSVSQRFGRDNWTESGKAHFSIFMSIQHNNINGDQTYYNWETAQTNVNRTNLSFRDSLSATHAIDWTDPANNTPYIKSGCINGTTGAYDSYINGSQDANGTFSGYSGALGATTNNRHGMGYRINGSNFLRGYIQEMIIYYDDDQTSSQSAMQTAMNNYYSVY